MTGLIKPWMPLTAGPLGGLKLSCPSKNAARNMMARLRVQSFSISIDGFGAGPKQDLQNPLGVRGPELFEWFFATRVWRRMHGLDDGETGVDNGIAEQFLPSLPAPGVGAPGVGPS
jgi:hypothetical protein